MTDLERLARALAKADGYDDPDAQLPWTEIALVDREQELEFNRPLRGYKDRVLAVLQELREPSPSSLRACVVNTDTSEEHLDFAAEVIAGMPPQEPHRQRQGIDAVADMVRDWQAMIDHIIAQGAER